MGILPICKIYIKIITISNISAQFYKSPHQVLYFLESIKLAILMQQSPYHQLNPQVSQKQPFKIILTLKQAQFLSKLLPLNYSLNPQKPKRGRKPFRKLSKEAKRSNLAIFKKSKQLNTNSQDSNTQLLPILNLRQQNKFDKQVIIPPLEVQQAKSVQNEKQINQNSNKKKTNNWMKSFIKECDSISILKKTFGATLSQLKQKIQAQNLKETDLDQTVINMINSQATQKTKKSEQLVEKMKKLYAKHKKRSINMQDNLIETQIQYKYSQTSSNSNKKSNNSQKTTKKVQNKSKRISSSSQSDLGFDMGFIDFNKIKLKQEPIQYDMFFINAAYISRNLRKIPQDQAIRILNKYNIAVIDLLKIKALSKYKLQELRKQVKNLKSKYPGKISDSQEDVHELVQSSFELQDD